MKCKSQYQFVVFDDLGLIELRKKSGEFVSSICCRSCVGELKRAITKLERTKPIFKGD